MDTCANCGRTIGNLETPHVYTGHVVCPACYAVLTESPDPLAQAVTARRTVTRPATRPHKQRDALFWPRMIFLALFIGSALLDTQSRNPDRTGTIILLCCWLLLGMAKLVIKASKS